jgi:hypothetical protein
MAKRTIKKTEELIIKPIDNTCKNCSCKQEKEEDYSIFKCILLSLVFALVTFVVMFAINSFVEGSNNSLNWDLHTKKIIGMIVSGVFFIGLLSTITFGGRS